MRRTLPCSFSRYPSGAIAIALGFALLGCPGEETDPGEPAGGDVVTDDGTPTNVDADSPVDTADTPGPTCSTDDDCADAFADLGACESAACVAGACERAIGDVDAPCDDGDPCTALDSCQKDPSGALVCTGTGNGCDDGDACNGTEGCGPDGCTVGEPLVCDDGNPCNGTEGCHSESGCAPGAPLQCPDDSDICNGAELCDPASGCISGGGPSCDDGSACTADTCDAVLGCQHTLDTTATGCCTTDADCDDGNGCTATSCDVSTGTCQLTNLTGACDTGDPCALEGSCQAGACVADVAPGCKTLCVLSGSAGETVDCYLGLARVEEAQPAATGVAFTLGYYGETTALLSLVDTVCIGDNCVEANIPQAGTSLNPSGHTVLIDPASSEWDGSIDIEVAHVSSPDKPINDGFYQGDALLGDGTLVTLRFTLTEDTAGSPVVLHTISASGAAGPLAASLVDDTIVTTNAACGDDVCFDGKSCTIDQCTDDVCSFEPTSGQCDDGNPCTVGDTCDAGSGQCVAGGFAEAGESCTGEDKCTDVGSCDGKGTCEMEAGQAVTCPVATDCVVHTCNPATGTCFASAQVGVACDDSNPCTTGDVCDGSGTCDGAPVICSDDWGCTTDWCDPASGCTATPEHALCDDGNGCTTNTCSPTEGCVTTGGSGACDDGDPCTENDACMGGKCVGTASPGCGCENDGDCAALEDGNLCNGTLTCVDSQCQVDPATKVTCPADGFQCQQGWTCAPATGQCSGSPLSCDDGNDCTADTCSMTKGCQNTPTAACPIGTVCEISGNAGELVMCELHLVRAKQKDPIPSGGDFKLLWDESKATLDNFVDEFCVGASCFPFDIATCGADGAGCTYEKLAPSGHEVVLVPNQQKDWTGKASLLIYHAGEAGKAITSAFTAAGTISGESLFLKARFELLTDIPAGSPLKIEVSDVGFNPKSGQKMNITIQELGGTRTFLATPQ